jgi:hypothetical protein
MIKEALEEILRFLRRPTVSASDAMACWPTPSTWRS